jgi:hypothetical protein
VYQREHVAAVTFQQIAEVRSTGRVTWISITHGSDRFKSLGDLLVQFHAIGDHHEGPVAGQLAQHLLGKEHHREALAAALRLPEHPTAPVAHLACFEHRNDGVIHAQVLVILADNFD